MKWQSVKLGDIIQISKGKKHNLTINSIDSHRYINIEDLHGCKIAHYTADVNGNHVTEDDLIIAWDGANAGKVGVGFKGVIGSTLAKLKIIDPVISSRFLFHFLDSKFNIIKSQRTGATIPHISSVSLKELIIPAPPIEVQEKIADILNKADQLRHKDQALIKKYDELAQSIFIDMFGDLESNPKGWEIKNLGDLDGFSVKCGPFGSALKKNEYSVTGVPVWIMDNIVDSKFVEADCLFISEQKYNELHHYSIKNDDIIISRAGTVGKMCVINSKYKNSIISTNLIKLSLNNQLIIPTYFVYLMKYFSKVTGRLKTGADGSFTHMNTDVLSGLNIPLPPVDFQLKYYKVLEKLEIAKNKLGVSNNLFQSLLQRAFNGELVR